MSGTGRHRQAIFFSGIDRSIVALSGQPSQKGWHHSPLIGAYGKSAFYERIFLVC